MIKENVLIDKAGSTIKYSSEGPDIEDLELEEEDVVASPINKIKKFLKDIDLKTEEPPEPRKRILPIKERKIKVFLKIGNPKKEYVLYGSLKKFHYVNKNFHSFFWIAMSVKTNSILEFVEKTLNSHIDCTKIVVDMDNGKKPSVFKRNKYRHNKKEECWEIIEFIMGATRGERTQIKMKIS